MCRLLLKKNVMVEIKLPKLGESISEATVLRWLKSVGEQVEEGEALLEVATDKVDSEIASPASGVLKTITAEENEQIEVGGLLGIIDSLAKDSAKKPVESKKEISQNISNQEDKLSENKGQRFDTNGKFISPLVRSIMSKEGLNSQDLEKISGSGNGGRILKKDILDYLNDGTTSTTKSSHALSTAPKIEFDGNHEIIEMDRMRSMIADHMVMSKQTSPHVTSYVEADVTHIVEWREKNKEAFLKKHGEKITFTPIFVEAVVEALKEFPLINVSVDGRKIIVKKDMHIGLATALPSGNLIVPVIKHADQKNLLGLTKNVNDLVGKARTNKLSADEVKGSTFTISNVGTFRNIMGTPIINQPEVAILATGAIRKRPAVVETEYGDVIAIRHMMYLSLSYDHRVVDGNLGGSFLARIGDHLEAFDKDRGIG